MPPLDGATEWLNSEPLGLTQLRGHVVVVNFWTLTCINWLRTEPYVRAWSQAYRDDGVIVIGVHTPEFTFEHEVQGIRQAIAERAIDYPVVVDNDYAIWSAFANHYWPALYFVDTDGVIQDHHFGEGRYEESERVIQRLLGVGRALVSVAGVGVEAEADWDHLRTPETYLGNGRSEGFASPERAGPGLRRLYTVPERLALNTWALGGEMDRSGAENVVLDQAGGSIAYRFHARDVYLVLSPDAGEPIPFRVLVNGEAPGRSHGVDVAEDGNGLLSEGRMYQLVREHGDGPANGQCRSPSSPAPRRTCSHVPGSRDPERASRKSATVPARTVTIISRAEPVRSQLAIRMCQRRPRSRARPARLAPPRGGS